MRERVFIILVVLMLSLNGELFAQNGLVFGENRGITTLCFPHSFQLNSLPVTAPAVNTNGNGFRLFPTVHAFGANAYLHSLGFFCRKEIQLDKITPLPVRFRLGSIDYVNYLEQKPAAKWKPVMQ